VPFRLALEFPSGSSCRWVQDCWWLACDCSDEPPAR